MLESVIINLLSGAVGGNLAGMVLKNVPSGWITRSVAGILGGGIGGQILGALGIDPAILTSGAGGDLSSIISNIGGGAVGGGLGLVVWAFIQKALGR